MVNIRNTFILLFIITSSFFSSKASAEAIKILFIGSSYFGYNDLPVIFENLAIYSEKEVFIDQRIFNGLSLEDHAKSDATSSKIEEQAWDYVVLQGGGTSLAYPEYFEESPRVSLEILRTKILSNNEQTKIIFCMPWAHENGMTFSNGTQDTFDQMQAKIYANTIKFSNELNLIISPAGWAWRKILMIKDFPLHYLHMTDLHHPTEKGSYLTAVTIYYTIFHEDIEIPFYAGLSSSDAILFQTHAKEIVFEKMSLWNITPTFLSIDNITLKSAFFIQNYPNPFNYQTQIKYKIPENGRIQLDILTMNGSLVKRLIDQYQEMGEYATIFNSIGLQSGMYHCRLRINSKQFFQKLILAK